MSGTRSGARKATQTSSVPLRFRVPRICWGVRGLTGLGKKNRSLGFRETKAVFFSLEEGDADRIQREWQQFPTHVPLDVIDAPYRDLGKPLLCYLRRITADPESVAVVVMPELIVRGTDRLLHNQRALYLKRLLIFEPRVILASVPYQLV